MNWHEVFAYDPETGNLIWKEGPPSFFKRRGGLHDRRKGRARFVGKVVGNRIQKGPHRISVSTKHEGKTWLLHRIVWQMHNGEIPAGMSIDHINGNPWDNRIENLRLATHAQNMKNQKLRSDSKSKIKGVYYTGHGWKAVMVVGGKKKYLGTFEHKSIAASTYAKATLMYHGKFSPFYRTAPR